MPDPKPAPQDSPYVRGLKSKRAELESFLSRPPQNIRGHDDEANRARWQSQIDEIDGELKKAK